MTAAAAATRRRTVMEVSNALAPGSGAGHLLDQIERGLVEGGPRSDAVGAELEHGVGGRVRRPLGPAAGARVAGLGEGRPVVGHGRADLAVGGGGREDRAIADGAV